jgi:hypothetical protein
MIAQARTTSITLDERADEIGSLHGAEHDHGGRPWPPWLGRKARFNCPG